MFYLSGRKGSGKSYYAVDFIVKNKARYSKIYANINGLKARELGVRPLSFSYLEEILAECKHRFDTSSEELDDDVDVIELDKVFLDYLISEESNNFLVRNDEYDDYILAKEIRENESKLKKWFLDIFKPINEVKEYNPVLIIVDECYTYFDKKKVDDLLLWFISYSRHMYIDLILISQDPSDISGTYLKRVETFINAVPISNQVFGSKFKYKKHNKFPFYKTNYVGDIHIQKKKEVFAYYDSGDKVRAKSIFTRYFIGLAVLIIGIYFLINMLLNDMSGSTHKDNITKEEIKENKNDIDIKDKKNKIDIDITEGSKYLLLNCHSDYCYYNKDIKINKDDLNTLINNTNSKEFTRKKVSEFYTTVSILATAPLLKILGFKNNKDDDKKMFDF